MSLKTVYCERNQTAYQAFQTAKEQGIFPVGSRIIEKVVGVTHPKAPPGMRLIGKVVVNQYRAFAVVEIQKDCVW